jgi:four helix bundle protein
VDADELRKRTQLFAADIIRFVQSLPGHGPSYVIGRQLLNCGTSVGANYRAACRARSRSDFVAKLKIVEEECDESIYWMELLVAIQSGNPTTVATLIEEAGQLLAIIVASIKTARASDRSSQVVNRKS